VTSWDVSVPPVRTLWSGYSGNLHSEQECKAAFYLTANRCNSWGRG